MALQLAQQSWPWTWGITGSTGYALATGIPVIHSDSDLDLLIRAPRAVSPEAFTGWQGQLSRALWRADTQEDTPDGGFALAAGLRDAKTLLKMPQHSTGLLQLRSRQAFQHTLLLCALPR